MSVSRWSPFTIGVAMLCLIPACSSQLALPNTVPVTGSVTFKGQPLAGVRVKFHPQFYIGKVEFIPYGETGKDGKFVLSTGATDNGAPAGEYLVTLELPLVEVDPKDGLEGEIDQLQGAYSNPDKSKLLVTIEDGENVLEPFDLK